MERVWELSRTVIRVKKLRKLIIGVHPPREGNGGEGGEEVEVSLALSSGTQAFSIINHLCLNKF